ncbi:MAG: hypothetical protein WD688_18040 [Candidatus Binatia bacterium]
MSNKRESWVKDENNHVIGKDTTRDNPDGSSTTTHQTAWSGIFSGPWAGSVTGVTHNSPSGTSTNQKK